MDWIAEVVTTEMLFPDKRVTRRFHRNVTAPDREQATAEALHAPPGQVVSVLFEQVVGLEPVDTMQGPSIKEPDGNVEAPKRPPAGMSETKRGRWKDWLA